MCGIAGIINISSPPQKSLMEKMCWIMKHRGPDGEGYYVEGAVALGHRRLSIIDLEGGKQPLSNEDGTVWITYNGEIYNFPVLRKELIEKGHRIKTKSDTETIVHAYEEYGVQCLEKLRGMFAFGIWDDKKKRLFLARDRLGKKPLYYFSDSKKFIFASELKAILQDKRVNREIKYEPDYSLSENDWAIALREKLKEAVKLRLISDVPLGAFLSGGIDSSTVVALMGMVQNTPGKQFSSGFKEEGSGEG